MPGAVRCGPLVAQDMRHFDHVDLRVSSLAEARRFYEAILPALGFELEVEVDGWLQYEARGAEGVAEFFGVIEQVDHQANSCRIAFWADSPAEVDRLSSVLAEAGARHIDGPAYEDANYYAVFFDDPSGNHFEICHRTDLRADRSASDGG